MAIAYKNIRPQEPSDCASMQIPPGAKKARKNAALKHSSQKKISASDSGKSATQKSRENSTEKAITTSGSVQRN